MHRFVSSRAPDRRGGPSVRPGRHIRYGRIGSPLGDVWLAVSDAGVCRVSLGSPDEPAFRSELLRRYPDARVTRDENAPGVAAARRQLEEYFAGRRPVFGLRVDLEGTTPFQRRVLEHVRTIPCGSAVSYGEIAAALGRPGAARAVGGALSRNPVPIVVPCHRVVGGGGRIGGFTVGDSAAATGTKRRLLDLERSVGGRP